MKRASKGFSRRWSIAAFIVIMIAAASCSRRPKNILNEKEMISLMADLQLAEAYSNTQPTNSDNGLDRYSLAKSVMSAHGVTQEQLDTTLGWYGRNLDEYVELYAKVDRELIKRKRALAKKQGETVGTKDANDLWPYTKNGVITPFGLTDGWVVSLNEPEIDKGDRLEWRMRVSENIDISGALGVEYKDGSGETAVSSKIRDNRFEITLQTDSSKVVERIYGTFLVKDRSRLPLFADSIRLSRIPFDSLEYKTYRSQKRYAAPLRKELPKEEEKKEEKTDSVSSPESSSQEKLVTGTPVREPLTEIKPIKNEKSR